LRKFVSASQTYGKVEYTAFKTNTSAAQIAPTVMTPIMPRGKAKLSWKGDAPYFTLAAFG